MVTTATPEIELVLGNRLVAAVWAVKGQRWARVRAFPGRRSGGTLESDRERRREGREAVNVEKLRTADDWVMFYRHLAGLTCIQRGGFVTLPVTDRVGVVHLPAERAERVRRSLEAHECCGPVLARRVRWSFLVTPDSRPGGQVSEILQRLHIGIPSPGGEIMMPTSLGRWTREGCHWVVPPAPDPELPPLSIVVTTALAVGRGGED